MKNSSLIAEIAPVLIKMYYNCFLPKETMIYRY